MSTLTIYADSGKVSRASFPTSRDPVVDTTSLGFIVNQDKSVFTPTQQIKFLGLVVNLVSMELSLPVEKLKQISGEAAMLHSQSLMSTRALSQFIGKLNAAIQTILLALLFYHHLKGNLRNDLPSGNYGYKNVTPISQQAQEECTGGSGTSRHGVYSEARSR